LWQARRCGREVGGFVARARVAALSVPVPRPPPPPLLPLCACVTTACPPPKSPTLHPNQTNPKPRLNVLEGGAAAHGTAQRQACGALARPFFTFFSFDATTIYSVHNTQCRTSFLNVPFFPIALRSPSTSFCVAVFHACACCSDRLLQHLPAIALLHHNPKPLALQPQTPSITTPNPSYIHPKPFTIQLHTKILNP